jgi:microcystin-dependent protein
MSQDYIGNVVIVGFNFPPRGYAPCDGRLLPIAQNTALFALIGTTYGGNGQTTFGLPDLRGRAAVGQGQGAGLSNVSLGEQGGRESVPVLATQMPQHAHALNAQSGLGNTAAPVGTALAQTALDDGTPIRSYSSAAPDTTLATASVLATGSGTPLPVRNPYQAMNYVICVEGVFPSRN